VRHCACEQDQVAALTSKGVRALRLTGDDRRRRRDVPLDELLRGQRLVYTTPEFLVQNAEMRRWLARAAERGDIARLVLDEAHCVFEWGNAFRPAYLELARWKARRLPAVPVTLASASVAEDDISRLADVFGLQLVRDDEVDADANADADVSPAANASRMVLVEQLDDRANLSLVVVRKPTRAAALIAQRIQNAVAIVYCLTRKECEDVCLELVRLGCRAGVYHGGMPPARREFVRKQWMLGHMSVICATSAFGVRRPRDCRAGTSRGVYRCGEKTDHVVL
jgi:bloom syndrome protein